MNVSVVSKSGLRSNVYEESETISHESENGTLEQIVFFQKTPSKSKQT